jgi:glucose/mannose-6-phosphate isomerase
MNLDDYSLFKQIDAQNMLAHIDGLPEQLHTAWELGQRQSLPDYTGIRQILLAGMGGSAIGADLVSAYSAPLCRVPLFVHRDYGLPAWAKGPETLVIASSHSGNTEETQSAFRQALQNGCRLLAIATGGELAQAASAAGIPLWTGCAARQCTGNQQSGQAHGRTTGRTLGYRDRRRHPGSCRSPLEGPNQRGR